MKKVLGLSIAALLLIGLVVGGTFAYFSDTETSAGNLFTAGTIDLSVNGANPWTDTIDANLSDLKPDESADAAAITLTNAGTNPMDIWMKITKTAVANVSSNEPELVEDAAGTINDIDTVIRYALTVGGTPKITFGDDYTISDGTTHGTHTLTTTGIDGEYIYLGNLAPAGTLTVAQTFKMDAGTTNWAQSDSMNFDLEFYAQQSEGDTVPLAPTPELLGFARP